MNNSIDVTLNEIRFDVPVVDVTVDNVDEATIIANAVESHKDMPTEIRIAPFQVPVLDAASVDVLLRAIAATKKFLVRLKLQNCTIDDSTGSLALVLKNTTAFYYTDDTPGANANVLELAKVLKRLDKISRPALIINTSASNLDVLIDAIPFNTFRLQLNGEMELNDAVIDSLVRMIHRVGSNFNEISARRCKITGSILPLLAAIRDSNISILGFSMPENQDPKEVYRMLELCKSIREITIENRPTSEFSRLDYLMPRLLSYNSRSTGLAIRQHGTVSISGSRSSFRSNIIPVITNTLNNVNNVNHDAIILHHMTAEELRKAFSSKKIMHDKIKYVSIYDSDVSSIEAVFFSFSPRVFKSVFDLTIQNSELGSSYLGRLADIFPDIIKLVISDNSGITTLSSIRNKKLEYIYATHCNLTSIDFEESESTIDVSGNLSMMDPPYKFALNHPDSNIRARNCGFSLTGPYSHAKIDANMTNYIRLDYFHKMLDAMALEVGMGGSGNDSFMIYDN